MVVDGGMESVVYPSPRLRDDSEKDQRELLTVCAVILIPYETAPMYGARPPFGTSS